MSTCTPQQGLRDRHIEDRTAIELTTVDHRAHEGLHEVGYNLGANHRRSGSAEVVGQGDIVGDVTGAVGGAATAASKANSKVIESRSQAECRQIEVLFLALEVATVFGGDVQGLGQGQLHRVAAGQKSLPQGINWSFDYEITFLAENSLRSIVEDAVDRSISPRTVALG